MCPDTYRFLEPLQVSMLTNTYTDRYLACIAATVSVIFISCFRVVFPQ